MTSGGKLEGTAGGRSRAAPGRGAGGGHGGRGTGGMPAAGHGRGGRRGGAGGAGRAAGAGAGAGAGGVSRPDHLFAFFLLPLVSTATGREGQHPVISTHLRLDLLLVCAGGCPGSTCISLCGWKGVTISLSTRAGLTAGLGAVISIVIDEQVGFLGNFRDWPQGCSLGNNSRRPEISKNRLKLILRN